MFKNVLLSLLVLERLSRKAMSKKKVNYQIVVDGRVKWYIDSTKKDDVAMSITLDIINENGNLSGLTLYSLKSGRREILARFEGE